MRISDWSSDVCSSDLGTISLPIIDPEICLGVAFLMFFAAVGWPTDLVWPFNLGAITIAHITFCFPFVTMVVRSRLASFNREQEEAAKEDRKSTRLNSSH